MPTKINMLGQRWGNLVVIAAAPSLHHSTHHVEAQWLCRCDCGNEVICIGSQLRSGHRVSCGCRRRQPNMHNLRHGQSRGAGGNGTVAYRLWSHAKVRAKKQGLPFNLKLDDVIVPQFCPVFPEIELMPGEGVSSNASPNLDRLIPRLGYVLGNVRVISCKANRLKNNATVKELRRIADWLEHELSISETR